jgi:S-adenosylmethionine synthetase
MSRTSEWVSPGHSDKIADNISEYILDRYLEKDPNVRYALEVMIKNNRVFLGGEITSSHQFQPSDIEKFVKDAVKMIGYNEKYYEKWGNCAININDLNTYICIQTQSPDISQGVDNSGWGDQGIFWGYAENNKHTDYMPLDHYLAKDLGMMLYNNAKEKNIGGLDIKTQITLNDDNMIEQVIVAIPVLNTIEYEEVSKSIYNWLMKENVDLMEFIEQGKLIINGTGIYQYHSSIGDCGITGRKLVVDFYGGNSKIGGGSPWTKDGSKSDLTLNLYVRDLAKQYIMDEYKDCAYVETSASCCIGKSEILVSIKGYDSDKGLIHSKDLQENISPKQLIKKYDLTSSLFSDMCMNGLFERI